MKIALDISQIVYGTGVSTYTKELIKALIRLDKKNDYLLFGYSLRQFNILKSFCESLSENKNIQYKLFKIPPYVFELIWNRLHVFPLEKLIGDVDIVHSSDWTQPKITNPKTKKVTTVHDMTPYLFATSVHPRILANSKRRMARVKKEADLIIAVSQTTKDDLEKFLEIPEDRIKVIYSAPSADFKPQAQTSVDETLKKFKVNIPYILSVATNEPRKNIPKLVGVFETLNPAHADVSLVLVGKHGWGQKISSSENVIVTNYVTDDELKSFYSSCTLFVYPSLYEGFGLPILEAMACGAPVITSNNSSMAEIAKDAAILVDPRSESQLTKAIEMVLNLGLDDYQNMRKASLERASKYTWDKTAQETLAVYEEVTKEVKSEE